MKSNYIHKAGGILIKNRKLLLERHGGNEMYIIPGGKLEQSETPAEALIRELREEFGILVDVIHLKEVGSFESKAVHKPEHIVKIDTFLVEKWIGKIKLYDGIEGIIWVNSENIKGIKVSPIATNYVIPLLLKIQLID